MRLDLGNVVYNARAASDLVAEIDCILTQQIEEARVGSR